MPASKVWGAAPADWDHLDVVCGVTADLLPVVSNPYAQKSPDSKIQGPGKTPSYYNGNGLMVGFPKWTQHKSDVADITRWKKQSDYGICLQMRLVRAIDVDVEDFDEAAEIAELINELVPGLPRRGRNDASKFLLAFELPGEFTKRRFKTKSEGGVIEFLATGQQAIIVGTHPKGARYEWEGGLPFGFPALTADQFEAVWKALNERFGSEESVESKSGVSPTQKRISSDTDDDVVRFMEKNWTVHSTDRSGRVDILCPFHEEHTTDSGESATSYFPAGVGGFEQGHFKCQHSHCVGRNDGDFLIKMGYGVDDFEVIVDPPAPAEKAVAKNQKLPPEVVAAYKEKNSVVVVVPNRNCLREALARPDICGCHIKYDGFREEIMISEKIDADTSDKYRPFGDNDYYQTAARLEARTPPFEHIPKEMMRDAVGVVSDLTPFDTAISWGTSLHWDGTPRIQLFLSTFFGVEDTAYHRAVAMYWWTAHAGRLLVPGIKADMAPILVGGQGSRKTSAVKAMAPEEDQHVELDFDKSDDDLARQMRGKLVAELGEMKGSNSRKIEHVKSFMSRTFEKWVPKFKEFATSYGRRCVLSGTTNDDEPLPDDESGHRRWLPFRIPDGFKVDVEGIERDRDQLWAEAIHVFHANGDKIIWEEAEQLGAIIHGIFQKEDSWENIVADWLFDEDAPQAAREGGVRLSDVITGALNIPPSGITLSIERRVGKCMKAVGMVKKVKDGRKVWLPGPNVKFR